MVSLYSKYTKALTFENFPKGHQVLHKDGSRTHEVVLAGAKGKRGTDCQGADTSRTLKTRHFANTSRTLGDGPGWLASKIGRGGTSRQEFRKSVLGDFTTWYIQLGL